MLGGRTGSRRQSKAEAGHAVVHRSRLISGQRARLEQPRRTWSRFLLDPPSFLPRAKFVHGGPSRVGKLADEPAWSLRGSREHWFRTSRRGAHEHEDERGMTVRGGPGDEPTQD